MEKNKMHLRHCILYEYQLGRKVPEACRNLQQIFGEDAITERTCRKWFNRFKTGDFDICDKQRSGRRSIVDDEKLKALVQQDPSLTAAQMTKKLNSTPSAVARHILKLGLVYNHAISSRRILRFRNRSKKNKKNLRNFF